MRPAGLTGLLGLLLLGLAVGCSEEARPLEPQYPLTAPSSDADPRIAFFEDNRFQVAQGGRYSLWYGCEQCHGLNAKGPEDLSDNTWRHGGRFSEIYAFVAERHPAPEERLSQRVPPEQLWQLTAYVRSLTSLGSEMRMRQSFDTAGEAQGSRAASPVQ